MTQQFTFELQTDGNYSFSEGTTDVTVRLVGVPFCPDHLCYEHLGEADNLRGRVIRGIFWLLRWWKP